MELKFYDESYQQEVEAYQLLDSSFTALPNAYLKVSQKREDYRPILGIENDKVVYFFVLDSGDDKFKYSDNSRSLLLRAFSTDSRETRKGYARQSLLLLPKFLKTNYPTYNEIVLGVNEYNQVVTYLYANLNFVDTKTRFLGKKGYQKIMSLKV